MFNLFNELESSMKDTKLYGANMEFINMVNTGFDCFDYLNGTMFTKDGKEQIMTGLDNGKVVTVIGKSGSGKTTFALQAGYNIIKKYPVGVGVMYVLDFENSTDLRRICGVTGMSEEEARQRVAIKKVGISTETVMNVIAQIKKQKLDHRKELEVDSGEIDENGKPIKILPPTVVLVDSIATMMPKDVISAEEITGQMSATAAAKMNTQLFKRITQPCLEANIIPIFINHINQKIETTIVPTQAQVNFLSQNETLPGGNACIYLCNTLIRITTATKLEEDKLFKIKGFMAKVSLVKSRTAPAGSSITMIYNQSEGFDNILSNLQFLKDEGKILGAGIGMYLEGYPDVKFSFANFKEKLATNPEFNTKFEELSKSTLQNIIRVSSKLKLEEVPESETTILLESEATDE